MQGQNLSVILEKYSFRPVLPQIQINPVWINTTRYCSNGPGGGGGDGERDISSLRYYGLGRKFYQ